MACVMRPAPSFAFQLPMVYDFGRAARCASVLGWNEWWTMHISPDADEIIQQFQLLRAARSQKLERDMHFIDAAYDRKVRRVQFSAIWNRTNCTCFSSRPFCMRRFCSRRIKWVRRQLTRNRRINRLQAASQQSLPSDNFHDP